MNHLKIALYLSLFWLFYNTTVTKAGPYILEHDIKMDSVGAKAERESRNLAFRECVRKNKPRECKEAMK